MRKNTFPETITSIEADALRSALTVYDSSKKVLDIHTENPQGWSSEFDALNGMDLRQLKRALKYGYTTNVKVKRIVITRGEGPVSECRKPRTANSWDEAERILKSMANSAPQIGYDKTDFLILFTNGLEYRGTYDLTYKDRYKASLYDHVSAFSEFYGGICKQLPNHLDEEQYMDIVKEDRLRYLLMLDNIIYPSANQKRLDPELIQRARESQDAATTVRKTHRPSIITNLTVETDQKSFFHVYMYGSRQASFKNTEAFSRWMQKYGLTLGEEFREHTFYINGAYQTQMIVDREAYLHLPQIAILMNGSMVRAYKEVTPHVTNIYIVMNYKESFRFDYNKPSGKWYLQKFFWNR